MIHFSFPGNVLFSHHWSGKFEAPNNEWMHLTRNLIDYELIVVTDGTLYIADNKQEYTVHTNEYLIIPPTDFQHGYKTCKCDFYWLHFHCPAGCSIIPEKDISFNNAMIYVPQQGLLSSPERLTLLFCQLLDYDKHYGHFTINDSITTAILAEIGCQSLLYKENTQPDKNAQLYKNISDYVRLHSSEKLTVNKIAQYFNYNARYLSSIFKSCSGITLKQFILQTKMEHAKSELINTNLSIEQIAYNLGFDDAHNFSHTFKNIVKLTPSEYRNNFFNLKKY